MFGERLKKWYSKMLKNVWRGAVTASQTSGRDDIPAPTKNQTQVFRRRPLPRRHTAHASRMGNTGADKRDDPAEAPAHSPDHKMSAVLDSAMALVMRRKEATRRNRQTPYGCPMVPNEITKEFKPMSSAAIRAALSFHPCSGIRSNTKLVVRMTQPPVRRADST